MSDLQMDLFGEVDDTPAEVEETPREPRAPLTYEDFDFDKLCMYAGIDCIATSGVLSKLWPELIKEESITVQNGAGQNQTIAAPAILESVNQIEMAAFPLILDLEINGIGYSVPRNRFYSKKMTEQIGGLDEKIFSQIGKKVDLNSGAAIARFLYGERGFEPPYLTKAGEPATDGAAIMTLAGLDPMKAKYVTQDRELQYLADMAVRRDISSVHNTFIKTYHTDWVKERSGRIHPSYNLHGTSSFRITGSDPNLTQLPRAKHGYNVRTCYTSRKGYVFISFDFSSAEVKVLANISKEPAMLKAIADGLDFHTFSASSMYGIPYDDMIAVLADQEHELYKQYKELRQISKVLTFSLLYGSSTNGIAMQLHLEKSEAERLINLYFTAFPGVRKFIEDAHVMAKYNKFVITPLGQRKREYGTHQCFRPTAAYNAALRNAQNVIIQSTTSSLGLITFAELNNRIKPYGAESTCTVYDSLEIECPIDRAAEVIAVCYDTLDNWPLETFDWLELPIGCEGDVGISWGETKVVHPGVTQADILEILKKVRIESEKTFEGQIY